MDELTLVVVDDEQLVRAGLRLLLDGTAGLRVVGEAADGREALERVAELDPDVVLMDVRMPGMDGLRATRLLLAADPGRTVVVLTTFDTDATVLEALRHGAAGFLLKDTPPAELVAAVRQAASGGTPLSPAVTRRLVQQALRTSDRPRRDGARERLALLTDREREIAAAVARGASNQEIAAERFISLATVKTHIGRIMQKLEAANRVQVALCVYEAEQH